VFSDTPDILLTVEKSDLSPYKSILDPKAHGLSVGWATQFGVSAIFLLLRVGNNELRRWSSPKA